MRFNLLPDDTEISLRGVKLRTDGDADGLTRHGIPIYRTNPSIPEPATMATLKRRPAEGVAVAYKIQEVDDEKFVKLFLSGMKSACGLTQSGMRVFELVFRYMQQHPKQDTVELTRHDSPMSAPTYYRGLRELLEGEFLYRTTNPGKFFINIRYIFNGDRLAFVHAYHRKIGKKGTRTGRKQPDLPLFAEAAD
jgi:hypothetical protein